MRKVKIFKSSELDSVFNIRYEPLVLKVQEECEGLFHCWVDGKVITSTPAYSKLFKVTKKSCKLAFVEIEGHMHYLPHQQIEFLSNIGGNKILVLRLSGTGKGDASYASVEEFDTQIEALNYCRFMTRDNGEYWEFVEIIKPGMSINTSKPSDSKFEELKRIRVL